MSDRTLRGSILPPSDRGRRLGRRLRSFLCLRSGAGRQPSPSASPCELRSQRSAYGLARRPLLLPGNPRTGSTCENCEVEITWYGQTCVRLRGRDAVVVADAYPSIVGPTGRGIAADIATYSHPDDAPLA